MTQPEFDHAKPLDIPRGGLPALTHDDIDDAVARLAAGHGPFAVDTERAMGIRYSNRAYLIQIKRAGAGIVLIDPVGIENRLDSLRELLADEWVLHAADQDLPSLAELGLHPTKIFDTEMAGKLLGFERVSLQAMVADILGYALAKEHSAADWSQRPLTDEMLAYAALDVDLLLELRAELTVMLEKAGRMEWCEQECEDIRLRKPPAPLPQPWRRSARQQDVRDRRALAMIRELWNARDRLAKKRDLAPGRVLPNRVLAELASKKPRSRADVVHSSLLRSRERQRDANTWWNAINTAWHLDDRALPERRFRVQRDPFPAINRWEKLNPEAAQRWAVLRAAVLEYADEIGIAQEVLLKPIRQKQLAWDGWENESDMRKQLAEYGARPWQIDQVVPVISQAFKKSA
ncbi:MAG: ribonuclease D [Actinomycetaceae bacterium]|nr:ribonuclease D [Actinomycetaceae bacterium]